MDASHIAKLHHLDFIFPKQDYKVRRQGTGIAEQQIHISNSSLEIENAFA